MVFNSKESQFNKPRLIIIAGKDTIDLGAPYPAVKPPVTQTNIQPVKTTVRYPTLTLTDSSLFSMEEAYLSEHSFEKPRLFPNPVHTRFSIEFPSKYQGNYSLNMTDILGRSYKIGNARLKPGGSNMEVNISSLLLKPGVYFLKILSDTGKADIIKLLVK